MGAKSVVSGDESGGALLRLFLVLILIPSALSPLRVIGQHRHADEDESDSTLFVGTPDASRPDGWRLDADGSGIGDDDPAEQERLLDRLWAVRPAIQTAWGWQSDGTPATHLGSAHEWQLRLSAHENAWRIGVILDKDRGEPWGRGPVPWTGPELKRWYAAKRTDRFHAIAGTYRIQHGFGLASGRRVSAFPARTNPLRLPGKLASTGGYAGSASGPVRSGMLMGMESPRAALRAWTSRDHVASSVGRTNPIESESHPTIQDVSATSAFVTRSSLERHNAVRIAASGIQAAVAGNTWQTALLMEHVRSTPRVPIRGNVEYLLPRSVMALSVAGHWSRGPLALVSEQSVLNGRARSAQTGFRWKLASGSGLLIQHARLRRRLTSPYSSFGRFHSDTNNESSLQAAFLWRDGNHAALTVRHARRHQFLDDGERASLRWAVDWDSSWNHPWFAYSRLRIGHDYRVDHASDGALTTHRVQIRWHYRPPLRWSVMVQMQAGRHRNEKDPLAASILTGITLSRASSRTIVPDWSTLILSRKRRGRGVVLYAVQPAPLGGFPVLSGSAPMTSTIHRLRWPLSEAAIAELHIRLDRKPGTRPAWSTRFSARLRVDL